MPAEHYRPDGLAQGYFCGRCGGGGVNMIGSGHGEGKCIPNPSLVMTLEILNDTRRTKMQTESLGQKLAATLDELEQANIKSLEEKANADIERIRKERQTLIRLRDATIESITASIEAGTVPLIKVKNYEQQKWIIAAFKSRAPNQDIWNDFRAWARSNALAVVVTEGHDGAGIESWVNISVEPVRAGTRGITDSNTHGLKSGLGVGEYRG